MTEEIFSGYGGQPLNLSIWDDSAAPKAVVQIIHGIGEYARLYDDFAGKLNENGLIVSGADNRCMGKTAEFTLNQDAATVFADTVEDNVALALRTKEKYGLPVFLYGHGYGSMVAMRCIQLISDDVAGVFLSGSAPPDRYVRFSSALKSKYSSGGDAAVMRAYGKRFNKKYASEGECAWLSKNTAYTELMAKDELCNPPLPKGFFYYLKKSLKVGGRDANISTVRKNLPMLIMTGGQDALGNHGKNIMRLYDMFNDAALTDVRMRVYQGVRHAIAQNPENSEIVRDIAETADKIIADLNEN